MPFRHIVDGVPQHRKTELFQLVSGRSSSAEPPKTQGSDSFRRSHRDWPPGTEISYAKEHFGDAVEKFENMPKSTLIPDEEATQIMNSMRDLSTTLKEENLAHVEATIEETERLGTQLIGYQDMPKCSFSVRRNIDDVITSMGRAYDALLAWKLAPPKSANSVALSVLDDADG
ncbi:hypothetical protein L204_104746 [Cryptococcus depauperatus]